MKNKPKSIKICSVPYRVRHRKTPIRSMDGERWIGQCDYDRATITVVSGRSKEQERKTFIHEALHAIFFEQSLYRYMKDSDAEEEMVGRLAEGLNGAVDTLVGK